MFIILLDCLLILTLGQVLFLFSFLFTFISFHLFIYLFYQPKLTGILHSTDWFTTLIALAHNENKARNPAFTSFSSFSPSRPSLEGGDEGERVVDGVNIWPYIYGTAGASPRSGVLVNIDIEGEGISANHSAMVFYFILFYFILFYFILFYFILFYFILNLTPHSSPALHIHPHRNMSNPIPQRPHFQILLWPTGRTRRSRGVGRRARMLGGDRE